MTVTNQRSYLATFVLDTRGVEAPVEELIEGVSQTIAETGCEVQEVRDLGDTPFVRKSRKGPSNGIYVQYIFTGPADAPTTVRDKFRLDRKVDRIMIQIDKSPAA